MAKTASGAEFLEQAKEWVQKAKTPAQLREAQAVLLPLMGMTLAEAGEVLGISREWVCRLRRRFIGAGGKIPEDRPRPGGRRNAHMSIEEEVAFLSPFLDTAKNGGILVVGEIKRALDEHLGRPVALSSVYNLLHRHGWRKLAPDKRHPKADVSAQEDFKKNSRTVFSRSTPSGRGMGRSR